MNQHTAPTTTSRRRAARRWVAAVAVATGALAGAAGAPAAQADFTLGCITGTSVNDADYRYTYNHCRLPDIDQRRHNLQNEGRAHCVPTAFMNALSWLARNGYPNLAPGAVDPHSASAEDFNKISTQITLLGWSMGTSAVNGTAREGTLAGIRQTFKNAGYGDRLFVAWRSFETVGDPAREMVKLGKGMDGKTNLVIPVVGWYKDGERTGGHAVTLERASATSTERSITIHDPADDLNLTTQSAVDSDTFKVGLNYGFRSKVEGYGTGRLDGAYVISRTPIVSSGSGPTWIG
ncbi:MAG TPA: hypothetical protein VD931_13850 [Baekduia sp.]|nr:hypothetical protein [Baekduia sp.]